MSRYLIDGSNICYENQRREKGKNLRAALAPLITLALELQRRKIDFECIFDSRLRSRLEERAKPLFDRLIADDRRFWVAHSEKADESILNAYRAGALGIIGNDLYREERQMDEYQGVIRDERAAFRPIQFSEDGDGNRRISIARLNILVNYEEDGPAALDRLLGVEAAPTVDLDSLIAFGQFPAEIAPLLERLPPRGEVESVRVEGRVVLLVLAVDRSWSIRDRRLEQAVLEGHRAFLEAAVKAEPASRVFVAQSLFSSAVEELQPATELREGEGRRLRLRDAVARLDTDNYRPLGTTALRDALVYAVGQAVEFARAWRREPDQPALVCRIGLVTDGKDTCSRITQDEVCALVSALRRGLVDQIVLLGVEDEEADADDRIDFYQEGRTMGLQDSEIVAAKGSPESMRHEMTLLARRMVRPRP